MSLTIVDPAPHSVKADGPIRSREVTDRALRAALVGVKRDGATKRRRYVYDKRGEPLGIVTFEPCRFNPFSGRRQWA